MIQRRTESRSRRTFSSVVSHPGVSISLVLLAFSAAGTFATLAERFAPTPPAPLSVVAPAPLPIVAPPPPFAPVMRTWTDSSGLYQVQARFVSYQDGVVRLLKANGVYTRVPFAKLSLADQDYVRTQP